MIWGPVYTEAISSCTQGYPSLVFEPGVWSLNLVYVRSCMAPKPGDISESYIKIKREAHHCFRVLEMPR